MYYVCPGEKKEGSKKGGSHWTQYIHTTKKKTIRNWYTLFTKNHRHSMHCSSKSTLFVSHQSVKMQMFHTILRRFFLLCVEMDTLNWSSFKPKKKEKCQSMIVYLIPFILWIFLFRSSQASSLTWNAKSHQLKEENDIHKKKKKKFEWIDEMDRNGITFPYSHSNEKLGSEGGRGEEKKSLSDICKCETLLLMND